MDLIGYRRSYNVQGDSSAPVQAEQPAGTPRPGRSISLTAAMLSDQAIKALNVKNAEGSEQEQNLAGSAKKAVSSGQLQLSLDQPLDGIAQFETKINQGVLAIKVKMNERSKYDVLSIALQTGSEEPVAMTLTNPGEAVARAAQKPSALLRLPDELLVDVVRGTGKNGKGVNLSLREVSERMEAIAHDQMSPEQRFVIKNGHTLQASGYSRLDMQSLAGLPEDVQQFVVAHGRTLQASGYSPFDMESLAGLPEDVQQFVVAHGKTLQASGHSPLGMQALVRLPQKQQGFILAHGETLQALGYKPWDIQSLAGLPENVRNFVVAHGETLQASGHSLSDMQSLACQPQDQQDFVVAHGQTLRALGHSPWNMQYLAGRSEAKQKAVLAEARPMR